MVRGGVRVIINADDLGMSEVVNAAVFTALERGLVTSASILANGPAVDSLAGRLAAFPDASFGVHLNVSEFAPLTEVPQLRDLLDDGQFCARSLDLRREQADSVYEEWCAQVIRVRSLGVAISHLDSHQHYHLRPVLVPVLKRVQARFGIERVRTMAGWRPGLGVRSVPQVVRAWWFRRGLLNRSPDTITTEGFGSVRVFRELVAARLLYGATFEVMAHPGNPHDPAYAEEMEWLATGWRAQVPDLAVTSWWGV